MQCTPSLRRSHSAGALVARALLLAVVTSGVTHGHLGSLPAVGMTWHHSYNLHSWISLQSSRSILGLLLTLLFHLHLSRLCLRNRVGRAVRAHADVKCGCGVRVGLPILHVVALVASLHLMAVVPVGLRGAVSTSVRSAHQPSHTLQARMSSLVRQQGEAWRALTPMRSCSTLCCRSLGLDLRALWS